MLRIKAVSLRQANEFVAALHRHHKPVTGHKFSIGVTDNGTLAGVCIVGRPVARARDDGETVEVTRLCTNGAKNACSILYAAAARSAFSIGYERIGTYILASENGVSLRAAGWEMKHTVKGRSWSCESRPREDNHPLEDKVLWEKRRKD